MTQTTPGSSKARPASVGGLHEVCAAVPDLAESMACFERFGCRAGRFGTLDAAAARDRSRPGCLGSSHYAWSANDVEGLWILVQAGAATQVSDVFPDESGTRALSFVAPDGYTWTLLQS